MTRLLRYVISFLAKLSRKANSQVYSTTSPYLMGISDRPRDETTLQRRILYIGGSSMECKINSCRMPVDRDGYCNFHHPETQLDSVNRQLDKAQKKIVKLKGEKKRWSAAIKQLRRTKK